MLKFTQMPDAKSLPKAKRMLWGGVRDIAPEANNTLHAMTRETFFRAIMDARDTNGAPILPTVIAWEKINGDQRYTLVEDGDEKK